MNRGKITSAGAAVRRQELLEEKKHEVDKAKRLIKDISVTLAHERRQLPTAESPSPPPLGGELPRTPYKRSAQESSSIRSASSQRPRRQKWEGLSIKSRQFSFVDPRSLPDSQSPVRYGKFLVRMFDGAMSETKQEAGWQPSSPTHETEQSRRSSIVLAAEEVRLIRNRPPVKPVDVTPIKLTLPAQRQTVSSPSFGPGKRLTTVISQTGSSAKQSSLKLQNYILSPESNPRLPTFGEASGGVIYSPSQGQQVLSGGGLFSPSQGGFAPSDLFSSPSRNLITSPERLGITSSHNFKSLEAIERASTATHSRLHQTTRAQLRDLIKQVSVKSLSRQKLARTISRDGVPVRSGVSFGIGSVDSMLSSNTQSQTVSSPRDKMRSMHELLQIGQRCKLNLKRLRVELLREQAPPDSVESRQKVKRKIIHRADTRDPEVRAEVKRINEGTRLRKRLVGEFLYSDASLQKLQTNDSKRLASLRKIKKELFLYGAKGSLAISDKFRYRAFMPTA